MTKEFWVKHFRIEHLTLCHDEPVVFIVSQWQHDKYRPNIKYLIYRLAQSIYLLATFILAANSVFLEYLTNWGYTILCIQSWIASIMLSVSVAGTLFLKNHHWQYYILKLQPLYWLFHIMATSGGFVITVTYWTLVAMYGGNNWAAEGADYYVHAVNSVVIFIDLCVAYHSVKLMHFVYPFLFGFAYTIFSVCFYFYDTARGGKGWVYPILNWAKPGVAMPLTLGMYIFLIVVHFGTFGIHKLRRHIHHSITKKRYSIDATQSATEDEHYEPSSNV